MKITINPTPVRVSVGNQIIREGGDGGGGSGALTEPVRVALLQLASKVAYIDNNGQQYYQDLYDALYTDVDPDELGVWDGGDF